MLQPIYRVRLRNADGKYSIGIPKEIAKQIKSRVMELAIQEGKIVLAEA